MCLAIPGIIKSIETLPDSDMRIATVLFGGITREASLDLLPEAKVDDYILVHVGVAISIVDEEEAMKIFQYLEATGDLDELTPDHTIG